jgi:hypothetical protein
VVVFRIALPTRAQTPGEIISPMPLHPVLDPGIVWVRRDCIRWGDRGPYHWTAECIDGRALVELDRREAEAMRNLRPCKLCMSRARKLRGRAAPARSVPGT